MKNKSNGKIENTLKIILLQNKGGKTRARIIEKIIIRPYNPNQIANILGISYNTASYHMRIMVDKNLIRKTSSSYGSMYEATDELMEEIEFFNELKKLI